MENEEIILNESQETVIEKIRKTAMESTNKLFDDYMAIIGEEIRKIPPEKFQEIKMVSYEKDERGEIVGEKGILLKEALHISNEDNSEDLAYWILFPNGTMKFVIERITGMNSEISGRKLQFISSKLPCKDLVKTINEDIKESGGVCTCFFRNIAEILAEIFQLQ